MIGVLRLEFVSVRFVHVMREISLRMTEKDLLGADGDGGHHASRDLFFAVREEEVGAAMSAEVECRDVLVGEAGVAELVAIGLDEIEVARERGLAVSGRALVEKQHWVACVE